MEFVKSHYRARWTGIVIERKDRRHLTKCKDLLTILIVRTATGHKPRKRIIAILDESWTTRTNAVDVSDINKDWFK